MHSVRSCGLFLCVALAAACGSAPHAATRTADPAPVSPPPARAGAAPAAEPAAPARPAAKNPAEIAASATPAIVSVRTPDSLGTGFIVRQDGWVATNYHVVGASPKVVVTLSDGRAFPVVQVVSVNRAHDLIILKIDAAALPFLVLGDSDTVRPGDSVVAIGHPLGLEDTVSNGLVSAVRHAEGLTVLQVSAPIAPGSSGGPLFNDRGEVIGVATAILQGGQNLNLGLPVNYVRELISHPAPVPAAEFAASMRASERRAVRIDRHVPDHPLSLLQGCSRGALALLTRSLGDTIEVGAPLYNHGNYAACYHVYDGAAADLERRLPASCQGPKRALEDGRKRAEKLSDPSAQAWAMRDAFDGILDVIARRVAQSRN